MQYVLCLAAVVAGIIITTLIAQVVYLIRTSKKRTQKLLSSVEKYDWHTTLLDAGYSDSKIQEILNHHDNEYI